MDITNNLKILTFSMAMLTVHGVSAQQTTPYGECLESSQTYQDRYLSEGRSSDFVCFNVALERELLSSSIQPNYELLACPKSSIFYNYRYQSSKSDEDQLCINAALEREEKEGFKPSYEECKESTEFYSEQLDALSADDYDDSHDLFACALVAFDRETEEMLRE